MKMSKVNKASKTTKKSTTPKEAKSKAPSVKSAQGVNFTPGECITGTEPVMCNVGKKMVKMTVKNTGDRPIQVGSHTHFFEANRAIDFKRGDAFGYHLNIAAGTAVRLEPGESKDVELTEIGGKRVVIGACALTMGSVDSPVVRQRALDSAKRLGFKGA
jgi:urease subunit beta